MSPVNSDDSSGDPFTDAGLPLTRKEIRAREKAVTGDAVPEQAYESGDAVPEQAHESGEEVHAGAGAAQRTGASASVSAPAPVSGSNAPRTAAMPAAPAAKPVPAAEPLSPDEVPDAPPVPPTIHDPVADADAGPEVHDAQSEVHVAQSEDAPHFAEFAQGHHAEFEPGHLYEDGHHYDEHHETYEEHEHYEQQAAGHQLLAGAQDVATVARPSKKVRRRRRLVALLLTLTLFVTATVVGAQFLKPLLGNDKPGDFPGPGTGQVKVSVDPGEGPVSVAAKLEDAKVVANAETFIAALTASGGTLSPGEYDFKQEMKNSDAVSVLLNEGQAKVMYFALNAGLRIDESLQAISEGSGLSLAQLKALSDAPKQFGLPAKAKNLEGFLAPGEYRFPLETTAREILTKLVKTTQDELKAQGVTDPAKQYDAVTVASIVQAEGGQAEYKDVAGAIYNRLKPTNTETNGLIQSDATVTYGLGKKTFHIDEAEKADKSNPYNTYAIQGLPAGPIGSPGKNAIDAAAKPNDNDYLYWVTINLDTKETKFSKTLAEHNGYVEQYNAWCEANPGRCV
ncbi:MULTISPECIES: endolytic transglycosylase MltG [unclassified Arthrobacter]|uniref:endolytic transglycosylase MltG n=1 Tax=unclassified Arthrobacter TaxID=235627 RepID=UPI001F009D7D|nr:endolytic transglycosylase MltG [Arthrobacter sp. FW305-BF8]UKA52569.1 endolytic transglycosylase MltG [Arthrobacter sp. FW305-BF8]